MPRRPPGATEPPPDARTRGQLTVEQLAAESGMTVRNIRNHQSRGLLPPPQVRARVGYYGDEHVARLRLIQEMQAQGFKLSAIGRLLGDHGQSVEQFLGLKAAITAPFETETPEVLSVDELAERFGEVDPKAVARAQRLGLLAPVGEGLLEAPSPTLLRAAEEIVGRGIPLSSALDVVEKVQRNAQATSRVFVKLVLDEVWKPFDDADQPAGRWPEVTETIERLRSLAAEVVLATFKQTMEAEVETAFGRALERQAKRR